MTSRAYGARSPRSRYDVILIVTSFAPELAMLTVTDVRTYTDTLPRLIYKDYFKMVKHILRTHARFFAGKSQYSQDSISVLALLHRRWKVT